MANILITGGMGFIGSHIADQALNRGDQVYLFDNGSTGKQANIVSALSCGAKLIPGELLNRQELNYFFQNCPHKIDSVFHLAARISVAESMAKPLDYIRTNGEGVINILDACIEAKVKNIVLSSSAAVYGDNPAVPKLENMIPEPKSPYAITKLDGEYYFRMYRQEYGINAVSLRYFNVFGERQDPKSAYAAAVPIFIHKALANQDITIFGDGTQTRDFIYVGDIAQANLLAADRGNLGLAQKENLNIYNVCWGDKLSINQLAQTIIELTGSSSKIIHLEERPGDIKHSMGSNSKIISQLGFQASTNLRQGLEKTIGYFQKA